MLEATGRERRTLTRKVHAMINNNEVDKLKQATVHYRTQLERTIVAKRKDVDSMRASMKEAVDFAADLSLSITAEEDQISLLKKTIIDLDKVFSPETKKIVVLPVAPALPIKTPPEGDRA